MYLVGLRRLHRREVRTAGQHEEPDRAATCASSSRNAEACAALARHGGEPHRRACTTAVRRCEAADVAVSTGDGGLRR